MAALCSSFHLSICYDLSPPISTSNCSRQGNFLVAIVWDEQTALAQSNCWPLTATLAPIIGTERAVMTENHPNNAIWAFTIPLLEPHSFALRTTRQEEGSWGSDSQQWLWTIIIDALFTWVLMKCSERFYLVHGMGVEMQSQCSWLYVSWFKHCHRKASPGSFWYVKGLRQK